MVLRLSALFPGRLSVPHLVVMRLRLREHLVNKVKAGLFTRYRARPFARLTYPPHGALWPDSARNEPFPPVCVLPAHYGAAPLENETGDVSHTSASPLACSR